MQQSTSPSLEVDGGSVLSVEARWSQKVLYEDGYHEGPQKRLSDGYRASGALVQWLQRRGSSDSGKFLGSCRLVHFLCLPGLLFIKSFISYFSYVWNLGHMQFVKHHT
ncbi:unnamed protein product [Cuscuta epithymum]|uniref:Uncharacterized protein n=1 Tax=Cuscuta epithymum TaxID=186058 RepID=A0AAV0G0W4_9ASTE|nr:unnamed protein product [Cuscuta epithymum]